MTNSFRERAHAFIFDHPVHIHTSKNKVCVLNTFVFHDSAQEINNMLMLFELNYYNILYKQLL